MKQNNEKSRLMKIKAVMKKKLPTFLRQDLHKKAKLEAKWRKPKGHQSKMRHNKKGHRVQVNRGYRTPWTLRGYNSKGLIGTVVATQKDVDALTQDQSAIISRKLGDKNRKSLLEYCIQKNVSVANIKNPTERIETINARIESQKKQKEDLAKKKEKRDKEKKTEEKKGIETKVEDETVADEAKDKEKKEKDKVLTKKTA
jgi:large subunit ribosomal protein L32e